jgi:hypothetical protein
MYPFASWLCILVVDKAQGSLVFSVGLIAAKVLPSVKVILFITIMCYFPKKGRQQGLFFMPKKIF